MMKPPYDAYMLPLETALIRWHVVSARWEEMSSGNIPLLGAFLAGWYFRCIGGHPTPVVDYRDSFRCGWREADDMIQIELQHMQDP